MLDHGEDPVEVKLQWITPDAERLIVEMARVSNPEGAKRGDNPEKLIGYLIRNQHWSPFEMASACFEITTTRDIARQMLRHRSFSFQEFSQRYAEVGSLPPAPLRPARMQDTKNRQSSLPCADPALKLWWLEEQEKVLKRARKAYKAALDKGIAKEVARAVLPEGLTTSRMFVTGTIRSWMHYAALRMEAGTQREHRDVAMACWLQLRDHIPAIWQAMDVEENR